MSCVHIKYEWDLWELYRIHKKDGTVLYLVESLVMLKVRNEVGVELDFGGGRRFPLGVRVEKEKNQLDLRFGFESDWGICAKTEP